MTLATKETAIDFPFFPLHNSNLSSLLSTKPGENSGEITFLDNDQPRLYLKVISTLVIFHYLTIDTLQAQV